MLISPAKTGAVCSSSTQLLTTAAKGTIGRSPESFQANPILSTTGAAHPRTCVGGALNSASMGDSNQARHKALLLPGPASKPLNQNQLKNGAALPSSIAPLATCERAITTLEQSERPVGLTKVSVTQIEGLTKSYYRATIGVVLLDSDETAEDALRRMLPQHIAMYISRVAKGDSLTAEALRATASRIPQGASLIIPGRPLDSIIFACTSASALLGEQRVNALLSEGRPGPKPTTLMAAVVSALRFLGAQRVGLATPYLSEITKEQAHVMEEMGFRIPAARCLGLDKDSDVGLVTTDDIKRLGRETYRDCIKIDGEAPQAIFLSCSQLRGVDVIQDLEDELGIPVVTSNQAMMWELLRLANVDDPITGFGTLMTSAERSSWEKAN